MFLDVNYKYVFRCCKDKYFFELCNKIKVKKVLFDLFADTPRIAAK